LEILHNRACIFYGYRSTISNEFWLFYRLCQLFSIFGHSIHASLLANRYNYLELDRSLRLKACYLLLGFLLVAPLLTSFLAGYLVMAGVKVSLTALCTVPAIILSIMTGYLE